MIIINDLKLTLADKCIYILERLTKLKHKCQPVIPFSLKFKNISITNRFFLLYGVASG